MYYIGFDIGGTNVKSAIVSSKGDIVQKHSIKTPSHLVSFYEGIQHCVYRLTDRSGIKLQDIQGIGIGIPGTVDKDGVVYRFVNLGMEREELKQKVSNLYPKLRVQVANDAYVAGLGELKFGKMKGYRNSVLLTLGTGIGCALVVDGKVYRSSKGFNPEFGHIIIGKNFFDCNCGNNGCFETFCSAKSFVKQARFYLNNHSSATELRCEHLNPQMILSACRKGDQAAVAITKKFVEDLSIGIANIMNTVLPDIVVLGGGLSKGLDFLLKDITNCSNEKVLNKTNGIIPVVCAELLNDAGVIGAAMLNVEE